MKFINFFRFTERMSGELNCKSIISSKPIFIYIYIYILKGAERETYKIRDEQFYIYETISTTS